MEGMPKGSRLVQWGIDLERDCLMLVVENEGFELVKIGEIIPLLDVTIHRAP